MMAPDGPLGGRIAAPAGPKRPKEVALMADGLKEGEKLGLPFPVDAQNKISTYYGPGHAAIDWALHPGTPICAMYDGEVQSPNFVPPQSQRYVRGTFPVELLSNGYTFSADGYGNTVYVRSATGIQSGFGILYAHLSQVFVARGDNVKKGDLLGLSGHAGNTTGPHVHVEYRPYSSPDTPESGIDFKDVLPPDYALNTNTFVFADRPLASRNSGALNLYSQPVTGDNPVGTLPVAAAAWSPIQNSDNPHVMKVGTFNEDDASVGNTVNIGDATNSVDFAGMFTLSLDGNTVSLAVTATVPATEPATEHDTGAAIADNYFQVSSVYLPENLRPLW